MTATDLLAPAAVEAAARLIDPRAWDEHDRIMQVVDPTFALRDQRDHRYVQEAQAAVEASQATARVVLMLTTPQPLPPWPVRTCLDAMAAEAARYGATSLYAGLAEHVETLLRMHVITDVGPPRIAYEGDRLPTGETLLENGERAAEVAPPELILDEDDELVDAEMHESRLECEADEGWLDHDGHGRPVPVDVLVEVRNQRGEHTIGPAGDLATWEWKNDTFPDLDDPHTSNITSFRLLAAHPTSAQGKAAYSRLNNPTDPADYETAAPDPLITAEQINGLVRLRSAAEVRVMSPDVGPFKPVPQEMRDYYAELDRLTPALIRVALRATGGAPG